MIGIYKITNKLNNKVYIGQSVDIERRLEEHKNSKCLSQAIDASIKKNGKENFTYEVIEECLRKELNDKEIYWINYYNSYYDGYNNTLGGSNGHTMMLDKKDLPNIINDLLNSKLTGIEIGKKYNVSDQTISDINNGKIWYNDDIKYPIREQKHCICIDCGKIITSGAIRCKECNDKHKTKIDLIPNKETLLKDIVELNFTGTGKKYGVSRTSIRRWCIKLGLPDTKEEIIKLYNKENNIIEQPILKKETKFTTYKCDKETHKILEIFESTHSAGRALGDESYYKHIGEVCRGTRKSAYGYWWCYSKDYNDPEKS